MAEAIRILCPEVAEPRSSLRHHRTRNIPARLDQPAREWLIGLQLVLAATTVVNILLQHVPVADLVKLSVKVLFGVQRGYCCPIIKWIFIAFGVLGQLSVLDVEVDTLRQRVGINHLVLGFLTRVWDTDVLGVAGRLLNALHQEFVGH